MARFNQHEIKKFQKEQAAAKAETTRLKLYNVEEERKKERIAKKARKQKTYNALVKLKGIVNMKVTRPVPTTHPLKSNSLGLVSDSLDNLSECSGSMDSEANGRRSDNGSQTPTKDLLSYRRPSQDLQEEDEFEEE